MSAGAAPVHRHAELDPEMASPVLARAPAQNSGLLLPGSLSVSAMPWAAISVAMVTCTFMCCEGRVADSNL